MAEGRCLFLLTTVFCSVSCVKIFPLEGAPVTLASGFNVKPSPVVPLEFNTVDSVAETPILPPRIAATADTKTENPSLAKLQSATDVPTKAHTIIPITLTITTTPQLVPMRLEPEIPEETIAMDVIAPTSVVKMSTLQTIEVPEIDLLPPKKQ